GSSCAFCCNPPNTYRSFTLSFINDIYWFLSIFHFPFFHQSWSHVRIPHTGRYRTKISWGTPFRQWRTRSKN
ncbi:hypothetical protein GALMADRAFT_271321, partial [Galerina marginata CBS 339.88]